MKLTEDDIYRTSTQFKNWSFTPSQLAQQRLKTNVQASERVKANVARQRAQRAKQQALDPANTSASETENGGNTPVPMDREVDCLTAAEEMRLVDTFCQRALDLGSFCNFPIEVTATGIQFLRRFYLYNSPMTYEGQNISRTAMFIASKTENALESVERYAARFPKVTAEQVLAPEYLIVQALRFNFEIKHPFRGLKGGHLEMIEMARGEYAPLPTMTQTSAEVQKEMLQLPRKQGGPSTSMTVQEFEKRLTEAYSFASHILKTAALLTDSYFLYTPSQIWFSAHYLADEPVTLFYLSQKLPPSHPHHDKFLATLRSCAALLSSHRSFTSSSTSKEEKEAREKKEKEEVQALIKKLRHCRDPDKIDLVKLNQAQKRDAVQDGNLEENKAKRRKLDRENYEKEQNDFWGPELQKNGVK